MDNKKDEHLLNTKQQEMSKHGILKKPLIVGPPLNQVTSRIRVISPRVKPATHYSRVVANILCDRPCNDPLPFKDVYSDRLGLSIFKNTLHGDPEFRDYTYKKYGSQFRVKELFPCSGYPSWDLYGSDGDKYNAFRLPNRNECIGNEDCWLPQYTKEYVEKLKWTGGCGLLANADFQRGFQMNRGCPGSGMNPDGTCKSVAQLTELTKAKRLYDWVRGPDGKVHKRPVGAYTDLGTSASAESMGRYGGRGGAANRFYNKKGMGGAHGKFVSRSDTRLDKRGPGGARVINYRTGQQGHAQGKGHHQQQQHHPHHYKKHGMQHGHHGHNVTVYKMDNVSVDGSGDSGPDDGLKRKSNTRNRNNKRSPNRYRSDRSYPSRPSRTQLKPDRSPSRSRNNKENIMEKYFADGKSRRDLTSSHVKEHKGALKSPDSRHGINSKHASRTGIGGQKRNVGGGRGRDGPGKSTFQKGGGAGRGYGGGGKGYGGGGKGYGGGGKGYGGGGKGYGGGGKGYGGGKGHAGGGRYDNDKNSYGGRPESGGGHSYGKGGKPGAGATGYDGKLRKSKQEEGGDHITGRGGKPGESLPTDSRGSITGLNRTRRPVKGTTSGLLNPNLSYHVRPSSKGGRYKTMKEGRERHHHQVWDGEGYGSEFRGDSDEEGEYIEREEDKELLAVNMCWEMASRVFKKPSKALVVPSADNLMLYLEMKYPKSSWGRGEPIASRQYPNGSTFVAQYANGASRVYYPHGGLAMAISGPSPETSQILIIRDPSDHMFFFDKAVLADLNTAGKGIIYGEDGVIKVQYSTIGGFKIQEGLEHGQRWHWHQGGQRMLLKLNKFVSLRLSDFDKIFLNYNGNRRGFLVNVATGYSVSLMNLERTFDTVLVELRNLIRPRTADDGHFDFEHGRFVLPRPPLQFVGTMFSDTESHKALC